MRPIAPGSQRRAASVCRGSEAPRLQQFCNSFAAVLRQSDHPTFAAVTKMADSAAKWGFWLGPAGPDVPREQATRYTSAAKTTSELGFC